MFDIFAKVLTNVATSVVTNAAASILTNVATSALTGNTSVVTSLDCGGCGVCQMCDPDPEIFWREFPDMRPPFEDF